MPVNKWELMLLIHSNRQRQVLSQYTVLGGLPLLHFSRHPDLRSMLEMSGQKMKTPVAFKLHDAIWAQCRCKPSKDLSFIIILIKCRFRTTSDRRWYWRLALLLMNPYMSLKSQWCQLRHFRKPIGSHWYRWSNCMGELHRLELVHTRLQITGPWSSTLSEFKMTDTGIRILQWIFLPRIRMKFVYTSLTTRRSFRMP